MLKACCVTAVLTTCAANPTAYTSSSLPTQNLHFYETFDEKTGGLFTSAKWTKSVEPKYKHQPVMVKAAMNAPPGFEKDKGLQLTQEMKYYAVSTKVNPPVIPKGEDVVFQYEMKFDSLTCGGAYLKILRDSDELDLSSVNNESPFSVMFGPDRCGSNNKVHFIMQHQSPITGEWEEKHFANAPPIMADKLTHLYTLAIHGSDNSFEIYIDKEEAAKGNLMTDLDPSINPPLEIDDPTDMKPADWVDDAQIPDVDATKPDDWDENQPMMIPDDSVSIPSGWQEHWPLIVPDPTAEKPDDWDDEEDGEWEAPEIPNPACEEVPGCGPWKPPSKKNPDYKGKWSPPLIDNPDYIGEWAPRKIPNENYFEEENPSHLAPIGAVAVEIWTTNPGIHYDNIIIAKNLKDAWTFADASFGVKQAAEKVKQQEEADAAAAQAEKDQISNNGMSAYVEIYLKKFIKFLEENPQVQSIFQSAVLSLSSILGPEGRAFVNDNAVSIIIGFIAISMTFSIFIFCACILPADKDSFDEEVVQPAESKVDTTSSPTSGNEADGEDGDTGLRQRNKSAAGTKSSPSKKKSRKDD